jgi:hypothetical protein
VLAVPEEPRHLLAFLDPAAISGIVCLAGVVRVEDLSFMIFVLGAVWICSAILSLCFRLLFFFSDKFSITSFTELFVGGLGSCR